MSEKDEVSESKDENSEILTSEGHEDVVSYGDTSEQHGDTSPEHDHTSNQGDAPVQHDQMSPEPDDKLSEHQDMWHGDNEIKSEAMIEDDQSDEESPPGEETPPGEEEIDMLQPLTEEDEDFKTIFENFKSLRSIQLEELPQDDDLTAEELELNQPLDAWVSELLPDMRELIAPQLYSPSDVLELPPEDPLEPLEPCLVPAVLVSQSPMMQKFQATLRSHLIRQRDKLENDIFDMERKCLNVEKEIRKIGLTINTEQEHLNKQRDIIEKYTTGIEEVTAKRKQYDSALSKKIKEFKDTDVSYKETVKEDKLLFQQFEEMNELCFRLTELEKTQNTELKFAATLSEKQKSDKLKLAQEKQKQDLYIWKLSQDLERLGLETNAMIEQSELKKNEISQLTQIITDIEADTEGLRKEISMILCSIENLVHNIKKRDQSSQDATLKLNKAQDELQLVLLRIRSYNKSLKVEDEKKSLLTSSKSKLNILIQRNQHQANILVLRQEEALERLAKVQSMIDSLDSEQSSKNLSQNELAATTKSVISETDDLTLKRIELKRKYIDIMNEMKVQSSIMKKTQKFMEDLSHENQDIGLRKLEVDCKIGELMTNIEQSKVKRVQLEVKIDNTRNIIKDKENQLNSFLVQKKKLQQQIQCYRSKVIGSSKRLENLLKFNDDSEGQTQLSRKVNSLKAELIAIDERVAQFKQSWMDTQNILIEQTYKLSQLESMTNTVRKHLFLTRYKKEKLENKLTETEEEIKKTDKEFTWFHNKLTSMTLENFRHEQAKEKLADLAKEAENRFVSVLKDAEEAAVDLQEEICCLVEVNKEMSEEIERLQREFLAWEKKWKMAVEARERVEKERAATGEIGAMKLEIHRMQVRYSQLHKAQEKLSQDLEMCIARRDNIMDIATAREKRSGTSKSSYTREQFNKKLESIKQKTKQTRTAMKNAEKEIQELEMRREELMNEYMRKQKQLVEVKQGVDKLELEIQEGQLHKYKSLELVVRRQRKIRLLDDLKNHRYRLFSKNETNLQVEEEKQEMIGSNLIDVVQSLISDFPKLRLQLLQIFNTVTTPTE